MKKQTFENFHYSKTRRNVFGKQKLAETGRLDKERINIYRQHIQHTAFCPNGGLNCFHLFRPKITISYLVKTVRRLCYRLFQTSFNPKMASSVTNHKFTMTSFPVLLFPTKRRILTWVYECKVYIYVYTYIYMEKISSQVKPIFFSCRQAYKFYET